MFTLCSSSFIHVFSEQLSEPILVNFLPYFSKWKVMNTPDSEETWILLTDLALMGRGRGREGKNPLDLFQVLLFMKYISS